MADITRTLAATLRLSETGDVEVFGKTADELARMQKASESASTAANGLEKAYNAAVKAVENGSSSAGSAVERLKVQIDAYKDAVEQAEIAGVEFSQHQRDELQKLESEYEKLTGAVGKQRASQQEAKRDIDATTTAAGGQGRAINSLSDLLVVAAGKYADFAIKALAVKGALDVASSALGGGVSALNKLTEATGGSAESFKLLAGVIPFPIKSFEEWKAIVGDTTGYIAEHTATIKSDEAAYNAARLAWQQAKAALAATTEAQAAAGQAAQQSGAAVGQSAAEWSKLGTVVGDAMAKVNEAAGKEAGLKAIEEFDKGLQSATESAHAFYEAAARLQQILEGGLPGAAAKAKHAVGEVFEGEYGNMVVQTDWGQEMPLIGPAAIHNARGGD